MVSLRIGMVRGGLGFRGIIVPIGRGGECPINVDVKINYFGGITTFALN